jgi:hypothetical protein
VGSWALMHKSLIVVLPLLGAALMCAVTWVRPTLAQCDSDTVLQQQVSEFNKLATRCEAAAIQEDNYVMRLWHWKACMWDFNAPRFTDQTRINKLGLRLYEPQL